MTSPTSSVCEIPTISGKTSYSATQVEAGIVMFDGEESAGMALMLKSQETKGPLAEAKEYTVLHGDCLVFCEQAGPAYSALYFYIAGFLDRAFLAQS